MGGDSGGDVDPNWLPTMIDNFAHQYHWTERAIMEMPVQRASVLANAMSARCSEGKAISFSPHADKVRAEMLAAIKAAEEKQDG